MKVIEGVRFYAPSDYRSARKSLWLGYIEPVLGRIAAGLMLAGLFALEAVAVLLVGIVAVLPFVAIN